MYYNKPGKVIRGRHSHFEDKTKNNKAIELTEYELEG